MFGSKYALGCCRWHQEARSLVSSRGNDPRAMFEQKPRSQFDEPQSKGGSAAPPPPRYPLSSYIQVHCFIFEWCALQVLMSQWALMADSSQLKLSNVTICQALLIRIMNLNIEMDWIYMINMWIYLPIKQEDSTWLPDTRQFPAGRQEGPYPASHGGSRQRSGPGEGGNSSPGGRWQGGAEAEREGEDSW